MYNFYYNPSKVQDYKNKVNSKLPKTKVHSIPSSMTTNLQSIRTYLTLSWNIFLYKVLANKHTSEFFLTLYLEKFKIQSWRILEFRCCWEYILQKLNFPWNFFSLSPFIESIPTHLTTEENKVNLLLCHSQFFF